MKKLVLVLVAAALATPAFALIDNSSHDIPFMGGGSGTDEICVYCHTPHGAVSTTGPLWNRNAGSFSGFDTNTYTSSTLQATISNTWSDIDAAACMTCHDGSAMDNLGNPPNTGTTYNLTVGADANLDDGTLSNDHPVNFDYDAVAGADGEIADTASVITAGFGFKVSGSSNIMQCSTCHDVHNTGASNSNLMVIDNTASAMCRTCHLK